MNIHDAIKNLELNNKYNIYNIHNLKISELKKQYHILALNYHPDKNISINSNLNSNLNSNEQFQNINNSYLFLKNIITNIDNSYNSDFNNSDFNNSDFNNSYFNNSDFNNYDFNNSDCDNNYYELIINFINIIIKDINNNIKIYDFQNDCKKYMYEIIEKFINKLNLHVLQEIYKILNLISDDTNKINIDIKIKNIILETIKDKLKSYNIYIINTKLNNIINSEVYVMEYNEKTIYIPLWHNELNYDNNVFKIQPILESNITIDENNNIHYNYYSTYEKVISIIRENIHNFPYIEIIIDKYNLAIPLNELYFKKYQKYIFKNIGIPKINVNNVFENNNKANIIIHIYLE